MSKVITFARKFPKGHIREGQDTLFVEKVLYGLAQEGKTVSLSMLRELNKKNIESGKLTERQIEYFWDQLNRNEQLGNKIHTIRNAHRWNKGEKASLRVWSGIPYNSPQIIFAPETEVVRTYNFEVYPNGGIEVNYLPKNELMEKIAKNDGLSLEDFKSWFKYPSEFDGQIICFKDPEY